MVSLTYGNRLFKVSFSHRNSESKRKPPVTSCRVRIIDLVNENEIEHTTTVKKWKSDPSNLSLARYFAFRKAVNELSSVAVISTAEKKFLWRYYAGVARIPWQLISSDLKP